MSEYGINVEYGALPAALMDPRTSPRIVRTVRTEAIAAALPFLQAKLARATPEGATGKAGQSVTVEMDRATPAGFVGYAAPAAGYMPFVEFGTRPHWPPRGPLELYAARKFGYAAGSPEARRAGFLIARKISRHGTRAQHVVREVADANRGQAQRIMAAAAVSAFRRATGG